MTNIILSICLIFCTTFLIAQSNKLETVIQKGHTASVKAVAVSADGKLLATGSRDRSAKLWDLASCMEIRSFLGHESTVNAVQFSTNGKWLITSSADNTAKVWDLLTGKEIFSTSKQEKYTTDIALSPDNKWLVTAGYNDSAELYEMPSGKLIKRIPVNADQGSGYGISLRFSPDGKWLAIGEDNKTARIFSTTNSSTKWEEVYTFKPEVGWCGGCGTLVNFSPDSKYLIKLAHNENAILYDLSTGKIVKTFGTEIDAISGVSFSKNGNAILVAGDRKAVEYEVASGKILNTLSFDEKLGDVNEVIYHPDNTILIAAFGQNTAATFELKTGTTILIYTGIQNNQDKGGITYNADSYWDSYIAKYMRLKNLLMLTNNDNYFLTGKSGTHAVLWNIASGNPSHVYAGHTKAVVCFDLSKDGKYMVTADGAGEAILWETATNKKLKSFKGHREPIFEVKFNKDATQIATASWDATMIVWDVKSGEKTSYMDLTNGAAYSMSFTPDGLYLVTGRLDKSLEMREPDSKEVVRKFLGHTDNVASINFGPDPTKMLTASWDGTARVWDIATGLMVQKIKINNKALHAAIYSPDGKTIFTAGDDRIIRVWDAGNAKLLKTLEGHQAEITCLKISQDGKMLVSYSLDGSIKCWNLEKVIEFYEHIHIGENDWMARTPNGYYSATGLARSAVHFVKGLDVYQSEQFFEDFYKPNLLPELFKSKGVSNGDRKLGMDEKLLQSPPPTVKLALVPKSGGLEADIYLKITDNGGGISEIRLMHNGKILPVTKEECIFPIGKNNSTVFKKTCPLIAGQNIFSAVGISTGRVESISSEAQVFSENAANNTVCHVVAIGINKYKNPILTLNYARDDAEAFVKVLSQNSKGLFKEVVLHTLYDNEATRKNILDTLDSLSTQVSMNDVFVFFYAGHGGINNDNFFFIPTECTRLYEDNALQKSAINATEIQQKLTNIKALKQIIIMDACHSGGAVEMIAMRGSQEEKAIAQLSRSAGIHVMASAGTEQAAKELVQLQHGLFTYVLLKAMEGEADGAPKDGKITIYELKSYLDDQVPEVNRQQEGKLQFPYTFSRGQDFPILMK